MKMLVTSANGFLGSALWPRLVAVDYDVVLTVRRPYGVIN